MSGITKSPSGMPKIAFVHGRPGPHPFHGMLAESVRSDFIFVDYMMRWHDRDTTRFYRYVSMVVCGFLFPRVYQVIVSEGPHTVPVVAKYCSGFWRRSKTIALLDNETLYFLKEGFYSAFSARLIKDTIARYDALICVGEFQTDLAVNLLGARQGGPKILTVHSALNEERLQALVKLEPKLEGHKLIFIGNGPSGWRSWYKGVDLLLDAFCIVLAEFPDVTLDVIGEWDAEHVTELLSTRPSAVGKAHFTGKVSNIGDYLERADLYVHIARGEAMGISILEAMCAGLPSIVSDMTGAREAVEKVSEEFVVRVDAQATAEMIKRYFRMAPHEKGHLSTKARAVALEYTEERAIAEFVKAVTNVINGDDVNR